MHTAMSSASTAHTVEPTKVIPLLQAVNRLESLVASTAVRLDPIIVHNPTSSENKQLTSTTVTARLNALGDALEYLLDNIEL